MSLKISKHSSSPAVMPTPKWGFMTPHWIALEKVKPLDDLTFLYFSNNSGVSSLRISDLWPLWKGGNSVKLMYLKSSVSLASGGEAARCFSAQASNLATSAFSSADMVFAAFADPPAFFGWNASRSFCNALRRPTPQIMPSPMPRQISMVTPLAAFSLAAAVGPEVDANLAP